MSNHPDNGDTKETNDTAAPTSVAPKPNPSITDTDELEGLKIVMLDSAELATRSANLAVGAGEQMKKTVHSLDSAIQAQKKQVLILMGISGGLLIIAATIFATMTFSLKSKLNQMDSMVSALNAESVPEKTAQQVGEKGQVLANQIKSLEGRFNQQSKALSALSNQVNGLQGVVGETGGFKKEMETLARLQRERQAADNAAAAKAAAQATAAANAANAASLAAAKQRERMVQYPRSQQETTPTGASGVLSTKP
ncbi:MAG: hypothetical protein EBU20_07755 [Betaproteobacteria bacterium]|nr:hypothetical protein [Betaproteobacteria bacterium]